MYKVFLFCAQDFEGMSSVLYSLSLFVRQINFYVFFIFLNRFCFIHLFVFFFIFSSFRDFYSSLYLLFSVQLHVLDSRYAGKNILIANKRSLVLQKEHYQLGHKNGCSMKQIIEGRGKVKIMHKYR